MPVDMRLQVPDMVQTVPKTWSSQVQFLDQVGCLARRVQDRGPGIADTRGVHTGAVLEQSLHACNDRCWDGPDSAENYRVSAVGADFRTRLSTCPCWTSRGLIFQGCVHRHTARFDPRHYGGEGVAGTPGACSQAFCHPISRTRTRAWTDTPCSERPVPPHHTTPHHTTPHHTTPHHTTPHHTTPQHNTTQHNTTQHNTTQHNTTQHNTPQHHHNTTTPTPPPHLLRHHFHSRSCSLGLCWNAATRASVDRDGPG